VVAILVLAVAGTAGAYGYRTFVGQDIQASPPPVIKADATPTKVVPMAQASESNKQIYDRVGEAGQAEKLVPREEKPVDLRTATVSQPRTMYPAPDLNVGARPPSGTIAVTGPAGPTASGHVLPATSLPPLQGTGAILPSAKKIRTVTIRPDMSVVPSPASAGAAESPSPQQPETAPALRTTRAVPPSPLQGRQNSQKPLALAPSVAPSSPVPPAPRTPDQAQPARLGDSGYVVQVSSQRSEADAQASYRVLQARHPDLLKGHSSFVQRADLGSRGVYYRAMVGPFASAEQAGQLCTSLKAAGAQCLVHRN
jgi:hypothetical protein